MFLNIILYLNSFAMNLLKIKITLDFLFIFCLFSSDALQLLMFVCPTVEELRFYECLNPCYITSEHFLEHPPLPSTGNYVEKSATKCIFSVIHHLNQIMQGQKKHSGDDFSFHNIYNLCLMHLPSNAFKHRDLKG